MSAPKIYISSRVYYEEIAQLLDEHARIAMACGKGEASAALHAMATVITHRATLDRRLVVPSSEPIPVGVVGFADDEPTSEDMIVGAALADPSAGVPEGLYRPGRTCEVDPQDVIAAIEAKTIKRA